MWSTGQYEIVNIGGSLLGKMEDYAGINVTGKVVLVKRGELWFVDKVANAISNGAAAIIVYDHELSTFQTSLGGYDIPFLMIHKADGEALSSMIDENGSLEISIDYNESSVYQDPISGHISNFSSYGTTPSLDIKPEISAPGGNIYSTFNNDAYGFMSGTSMAAPHVSGGSALMLQRVNAEAAKFGVVPGSEEAAVLAKNILMNTGKLVRYSQDNTTYASPRVQGAGTMNLRYAMETDVVVTDVTTGLAKVNLGEVGYNPASDNAINMTLSVQNFGSERIELIPTADVVAGQLQYNEVGIIVDSLETTYLVLDETLFTVDGELIDSIVLEANETKLVDVSIVVNADDLIFYNQYMYNGFFLEGFVSLYKTDDTYDTVLNEQLEIVANANAEQGILDMINAELLAKEAELEAAILALETAGTSITAKEAELVAMEDAFNDVMAELDATLAQKAVIEALEETLEIEKVLYALLVSGVPNIEDIDAAIAGYIIQVEVVNLLLGAMNEELANMDIRLTELLEIDPDLLTIEEQIEINSILETQVVAQLIIDQMTNELNRVQGLLDNLVLSKEDIDIFYEVFRDVKAQLEATEAAIASANLELIRLMSQFSAEDQAVLDAYLNKQMEITILSETLAPLEDAIDDMIVDLQDYLPLSVPFVSFMGDWRDASAFDVSLYDDYTYGPDGRPQFTFYGETALVDIIDIVDDTTYFEYLGVSDEVLYSEISSFSPNNDGNKDGAAPRVSLLRNLRDLRFEILNDTFESVKTLGMVTELRKNYFDFGYNNPSYLVSEFEWDGTIGLNDPVEGQYYYRISGILADGITEDELLMPIMLDLTAPVINKLEVSETTINVNAVDQGVGISEIILYNAETMEALMSTGGTEFPLDSFNGNPASLVVEVNDYAGNASLSDIFTINDNNHPEVRMNIEPYSVYATNTIEVVGQVYEFNDPKITIDGEVMTIDENNEFRFIKQYDTDGKKGMVVEAEDGVGNYVSFTRHFFVDSQAPVITSINNDFYGNGRVINVANDVNTYTLEALITDNYPDLYVYLNGSNEYSESASYREVESRLQPSSYSFSKDVNLVVGTNTFELSATDTAEAETIVKFVINRAAGTTVAPVAPSTGGTVPVVVATEELVDEETALASPMFRTTKYANGYVDGSFEPEASITRAEISALVTRVLLLEASNNSKFSDVKSTYWALENIATMENAELIKGYNGKFMPNDNITRAEMATIISRVIDMIDVDVELLENPYTDIKSHWGSEAIVKAYSYGVETYKGSKEFNPNKDLTRAEAVVMINQLLKVDVEDEIKARSTTSTTKTPASNDATSDEEKTTTTEVEVESFTDVTPTHWAYKHIESASLKEK